MRKEDLHAAREAVPLVAREQAPLPHVRQLLRAAYSADFGHHKADELLDGEIFYSLKEARIVIESWRHHYNTVRPHESLGYKPPAPEVFVPTRAALQPTPAPPPALAQRPSMN